MIRKGLIYIVLLLLTISTKVYGQTAYPPQEESPTPPPQQSSNIYSPTVHIPGNVLSLPGIVTQNPNNVKDQGIRFNQVYPSFGQPIGWIDSGATLVFKTPPYKRKYGRVYVTVYQPQPNIIFLPNGAFSWSYYVNTFSSYPVQQVIVIYPETYTIPITLQNLPYADQIYYVSYPYLNYNCYIAEQLGSGYVFDQYGRCVGEIHRYPLVLQNQITVEGEIGNIRIRYTRRW